MRHRVRHRRSFFSVWSSFGADLNPLNIISSKIIVIQKRWQSKCISRRAPFTPSSGYHSAPPNSLRLALIGATVAILKQSLEPALLNLERL
jgi:hypothetical protein